MSENRWFIVNATEVPWCAAPGWGRYSVFEPEARPFRDFGINIAVIEPGDVSSMYHGEAAQEDFLVLAGECLLLIDGEERRLRAWDFVHCEAWVEHTFVGAGDGPCAILMAGGRRDGEEVDVTYPVAEVAARHGASVSATTTSPEEAYVDRPPYAETGYLPGTLPGA
jgi:uncharacterized cupin superfamily protein